ncbi:hypothetical protein ACE8EZ_03345 [Pantoea deleyi]|uniref:hypothetical protein n=1 Tax=Pantoea deleyi TaxID=470932 RepID=UPI0025850F5F|nr:hypothetical protein [uncultured Pantoea sp.]
MADSARGKERKVKNACIIPGMLSASVFLTSANMYPQDGYLGFVSYETARFFVILLASYGGISILKDLALYFMSGSEK